LAAETRATLQDAVPEGEDNIFEYNEELTSMNAEQVKAAVAHVNRRHPLMSIPLTSALPYLKIFTLLNCCRRLDQRVGI